MTPEEKQRIVSAGISKLRSAQPGKPSPYDELIDKTQLVTSALREHIRPILRAGGWRDKPALRALISTLYLEAFSHFSKDELLNLCTILHMELMMETIEANPYDNECGSDALSGK